MAYKGLHHHEWHNVCIFSTDLSSYGWQRQNQQLKVVWDTEENLQQVHRTVDYLTQGCKCKTGCGTQRCKCMKGSLKCGPSCQCVNCRNTTKYTAQNNDREEELLEEIYAEALLQQDRDDAESEYEIHSDREGYSTDEEDRLETLNQEVDQLMEDVFGVSF